ncbi:MAG TPA: hypothetical protein VGE14_03445 [Marmoricola sp.]
MSDDLLLPAGARLVHIGPQKTGTTSIQVALSEARDEMAAHGAWYPTGPYRRRKAGWALGLPGAHGDVSMQDWDDLVAEVRAAGDVRACISDEGYARAESPVAEKIVRELGDERVHVVAVARRLDRFLPSQWQERVKSGMAKSYADWLAVVLGDEPAWERWNVWQGHDIGGLVERWLEFVDPERFTLVISDESDREQLSRTFEELLGLPGGMLRSRRDPKRSNESVSWSELEVLRALHGVFGENGWSREEYRATLRQIVYSLRAHPEQAFGPRTVPMPDWATDRVSAISDQLVEKIQRLPVRVVGDPEQMRVAPASVSPDAGDQALGLPPGLVAAAVEGAVRAERKRTARMLKQATHPPATDLDGRELVRLLGQRISRRVRGT